jgi:Archaeal enzymes of ATP-grasp superfamily
MYEDGPGAGAKAPILVTHFEGAMDAGAAGTLATVQLLRTLSPERVATFDIDELIDYRSHRPVMTMEDWVTTDVVTPEIALDLVHDDAGTPVLVLHGPEPDARWEAFARDIADIAKNAGVELVASFHGVPAAVPHTRPTAVHVQSTDKELVPEQSLMGGVMRFPAPLSAFLQYRLSKQGIHGMGLVAAVPYYMSESTFPRAGSALLSKLSELTDLSLPIGDLEQGADEDAGQVERALESNPDVHRAVESLENHYDAVIRGEASFLTTPVEDESLESVDENVGEALGEAIERYLRSQSASSQSSGSQSAGQQSDGQTESGAESDGSDFPPRGRHRAPKPWEGDPDSQ